MSDLPVNDPRVNLYRLKSAHETDSVLLEVTFPDATEHAVAVIIDHSDSNENRGISSLLGEFEKHLDSMPSSWGFWVYDLGSAELLSTPGCTIANHQSEIGRLAELIRCPERTKRWRSYGSFITPVLSAISSHSQSMGIQAVTVFVITDGELFDSTGEGFLEHLSVIGIHPPEPEPLLAHWRRVFPRAPMLSIADPSLDTLVRDQAGCFSCGSELTILNAPSDLRWDFLDIATGALRPAPKGTINVSGSNKPTYLYCENFDSTFSVDGIRFRSEQTNVTRQVKPVEKEGPAKLLAVLNDARQSRTASSPLLFDVSNSDPDFVDIWREFCDAALLAENGKEWIDNTGCLCVFRNLSASKRLATEDGFPKWDALLAVSNRSVCEEDNAEQPDKPRVILLGINKNGEYELDDRIVRGIELINGPKRFRFERKAWYLISEGSKTEHITRECAKKVSELQVQGWSKTIAVFSGPLRD